LHTEHKRQVELFGLKGMASFCNNIESELGSSGVVFTNDPHQWPNSRWCRDFDSFHALSKHK